MKMRTGWPSARPTAANAMPVLPLVASTISSPGAIAPRSYARPRIWTAIRSLIEPVMLRLSHLANSRCGLTVEFVVQFEHRRVADDRQQAHAPGLRAESTGYGTPGTAHTAYRSPVRGIGARVFRTGGTWRALAPALASGARNNGLDPDARMNENRA